MVVSSSLKDKKRGGSSKTGGSIASRGGVKSKKKTGGDDTVGVRPFDCLKSNLSNCNTNIESCDISKGCNSDIAIKSVSDLVNAINFDHIEKVAALASTQNMLNSIETDQDFANLLYFILPSKTDINNAFSNLDKLNQLKKPEANIIKNLLDNMIVEPVVKGGKSKKYNRKKKRWDYYW